MSTEQPTPILDDLARIQAVDRRDMLRLVRETPEHCETALGVGLSLSIEPLTFTPNVVFITGVGDSGLAADMVVGAAAEALPVPILSDHGGRLPAFITDQSLVFVVDYAGKSASSISNYREARARGASVICVTSGGMLKEIASKDGSRVIKVPPGLPARSAISYLFVPVVVVLEKLGLTSGQAEKLSYGIRLLKNVRETLRSEVPEARNVAKQTAQLLKGKFVVVLGAADYRSIVAKRLKSQINANAKSASCSEDFPDVVEGAISAWEIAGEQCKDVAFVFLKDRADKSEITEQMDAACQVLAQFNTVVLEIKGSTNIEKLLYGMYLADFISCYLAFLVGVDPSTNEFVARLDAQISIEDMPEESEEQI